MALVLCPLTGLATVSIKSVWAWTPALQMLPAMTDKDTHDGGGTKYYPVTPQCTSSPEIFITCEFCVKDLFVLLPDLLLVVFKQPFTQVAHLLQCKRGLVLSWGAWETKSEQLWKGRITRICCNESQRQEQLLPGKNLQLCFLLSVISSSQQGHAALMWANSQNVLCVFVSLWVSVWSQLWIVDPLHSGLWGTVSCKPLRLKMSVNHRQGWQSMTV